MEQFCYSCAKQTVKNYNVSLVIFVNLSDFTFDDNQKQQQQQNEKEITMKPTRNPVLYICWLQ